MSKRYRVKIQKPLPGKQKQVLASPARFKVLAFGRRATKTNTAFIAATVGHAARPNGKGMLNGGDIIWVARDYKNAFNIWRTQIKARFANKAPAFIIREADHRIEIPAGGSIQIFSAENIDSARGFKWDGAIVDEAAHLDLDYAWNDVVRPSLVDRLGWGMLMSTTKGGSYFNHLCERVIAGEMSAAWVYFHATMYDNPELSKEEIDDVVAEYKDEVKLKQEVFAELVVPGGLAFPEWDTGLHVTDFEPDLLDWDWVGCLDWGYSEPGWFGLAACGPGQRVAFRSEYRFRQTEPREAGRTIGLKILRDKNLSIPCYIVGDSAMFSSDRSSVTIAEELQSGLADALGPLAPAVIPSAKGPGSRLQGKVLVHQMLAGNNTSWGGPRLTFHPDCGYAIATFPRLPRDPNNSEDVDTKADDHAYDAVRYLLMNRLPLVEAKTVPGDHRDRFRGFRDGKRLSWFGDEEEDTGLRYHRERRGEPCLIEA